MHLHKTYYGPSFLKTKEKHHRDCAQPACLPACLPAAAAGSWAPINASIHLGSTLSQKNALGLKALRPGFGPVLLACALSAFVFKCVISPPLISLLWTRPVSSLFQLARQVCSGHRPPSTGPHISLMVGCGCVRNYKNEREREIKKERAHKREEERQIKRVREMNKNRETNLLNDRERERQRERE